MPGFSIFTIFEKSLIFREILLRPRKTPLKIEKLRNVHLRALNVHEDARFSVFSTLTLVFL